MALPANAYLYEFLYRGQPSGSAVAPDYHVIIAVPGTDAFGNPTLTTSQAMTPAQAQAQGFDLPSIVSTINTALMAQNAALQAQLAALTPSPSPTAAAPAQAAPAAPTAAAT